MSAATRPHYAGTQHVPPKPGTRGFIRVVQRGCGGSRDYWGEFDCDHGYTWTCDECPWLAEHQRESAEAIDRGRALFFDSLKA